MKGSEHDFQVKVSKMIAKHFPDIGSETKANLTTALDCLNIIKAPSVRGMDEKAAVEKLIKSNVKKKNISVKHKKMTYTALVEFSDTAFFGEVGQQKASQKEVTLVVPEADLEDAFTVQMYAMGSRLAWPLPGYETLSSHFGHRSSPGGIGSTNHQGIDVPAPTGTPIIAVKEGKVETASRMFGYGNCVVIDHENGFKSLYGHMTQITCNVGDTVKPGDVIGKVGSTGWSTGSHLHFGLTKDGEYIDPEPFFTGKENIKAGEEVSVNLSDQETEEQTEPAKKEEKTKETKPQKVKEQTKKETEAPKETTQPTTPPTAPTTKPTEPPTEPKPTEPEPKEDPQEENQE